jgi:hypothetical protein
MYVAEWKAEKGWDKGALKPYGPLQMMPSAQVRGLQERAAVHTADRHVAGMGLAEMPNIAVSRGCGAAARFESSSSAVAAGL